MPQNIQLRQRIGGSFNSTDSILYPQTTTDQVIGLLTSGKITSTLLPDFVFGGLQFIGTAGGTGSGTMTLNELIDGGNVSTTLASVFGFSSVINLTVETAKPLRGAYFVALQPLQLSATSSGTYDKDTLGTDAVFDDGVAVSSTGIASLETGDWIVVTGYDSVIGALKFSVINNTYGEVTTSTAGIMSASDKTKLDGIASNANNYVHPSITAVNVDTSGSTIIDSIVSNGNGHLTSVGTRTLTLADLGYVAPTPYTHPTHPGDDIDLDTGALTGAVVISDLDFNITTDTQGHVTDANATFATRTLTLANLGYVAPTINNGLLDINQGSGITLTITGGDFSADKATETDITISHADTSSVANQDLTDAETVDTITFDTYGHITAITKQAIRASSKTATGLIEIATSGTRTGTLTEAEAGTDDTRSMTPVATKSSINYHTGNTLYASFSAADTAGHPDGAIVFVTV